MNKRRQRRFELALDRWTATGDTRDFDWALAWFGVRLIDAPSAIWSSNQAKQLAPTNHGLQRFSEAA